MDRRGFNKILFLIIGLVVGYQIGQWLTPTTHPIKQKVNQVLELTEKYYIESIDPDTLSEVAIEGILSKLDPHSTYIPRDIQKSFEEQLEGNFEGIGIEFQIIDDTITVVSPIVGTPSDRLGLMPGDRIVKIEDTTAIGFTNMQVIKKLRGKRGSIARIQIYRPSEKSTIDYEIERDIIPINSVEISLMFQDSVGYISLTRFAEKTADELLNELESLDSQGMKYLILDLRNNPGGLYDQAVKIADYFLSDDKLIVFTKGRIKEFNNESKAAKEYPYENIPLVILINRGSASASEIVAGAVQDWDRGIIVGETSFGKGLVQRPFLLSDDSALRLTISEYFTPSGRAIQRDYKSGKNYYEEVMIREEQDEDKFDHQSEADSLKDEFTTAKGRKVYSGGGITPDYKITSGILTKFTASVRSKNLFYQFIRNQIDTEKIILPETIKQNLNELISSDIFDNEKLKEFRNYLVSKEIVINDKEFEKDSDYIKVILKAYLAKEYFNNYGWYSIMLHQDEQFQKAIKLLPNAKSMLE